MILSLRTKGWDAASHSVQDGETQAVQSLPMGGGDQDL